VTDTTVDQTKANPPGDAAVTDDGHDPDRRSVLGGWLAAGTLAALAAAYGTLAVFMGRFLYPSGGSGKRWMYITQAREIASGGAIVYTAPNGASINIARQGETDDSLIALSSTCPHLGCQVHWEAHNDRFFCPCHNGIFDPSGVAIGGPPADAGQSLPDYPLKVENGLLFIELDAAEVAAGPGKIELPDAFRQTCPIGPGHDPCLYPERTPRQAGAPLEGKA
jgi:nitrite reductase/ring-hydroxylating ferredoxin subunit